MRAEQLNPFIKCVTNVIEETLGETPERGNAFLRTGTPCPDGGIAIVVGFTGKLSGHVVLSLPEKSARYVAAKMLVVNFVGELDEIARSAIAEMANMIAANATIDLCNAGWICDITTPIIVTGTQINVFSPRNSKSIVIPMKLSMGPMELNITLHEANGKK